MPEWVGSLKHLVKIHLGWSRLNEDQITEMLGELPKLMLLSLRTFAYFGKKLVFRARSFLNLRKLSIQQLGELREVRFENGASPQMELLEFSVCDLESGIIGIIHLPVLEQISLGYKGKVGNLDILQGEVDAHPNHPVLQLNKDRSEHDLGDVIQGSNVAETEDEDEPSSLLETCTAGESSQPEVVVMPTRNVISHDDLLYTYNSC